MQIKKTSRVLFIRPQLLGIALGWLGAFFVAIISLTALGGGILPHPLIDLFYGIFPGFGLSLPGILIGMIWAFLYAFILGFLIGWIYSTLLYQKLQAVSEPGLQYNPDHKINVLQRGQGSRPFTVVFVANPLVVERTSSRFTDDPIMEDQMLFLRTVIRCLRSFANNELLRLPEIATRIRFVTLYDTTRREHKSENALCETIAGVGNLLAPREDVNLIHQFVLSAVDGPRSIAYADLIYVISATDDYTRSTARFMVDESDGVPFKFSFGDDPNALEERIHAYHARVPGVVALWAGDDRLKTPVHELAHALSSLQNGAIVDEYLDHYDAESEMRLTHVINRKRKPAAAHPVPDIFARYQGPGGQTVTYYSDRYRSDKPSSWTSYVPERPHISTSCIMDAAYFSYRYDKLIFDFLYDRLMAKLNRPAV